MGCFINFSDFLARFPSWIPNKLSKFWNNLYEVSIYNSILSRFEFSHQVVGQLLFLKFFRYFLYLDSLYLYISSNWSHQVKVLTNLIFRFFSRNSLRKSQAIVSIWIQVNAFSTYPKNDEKKAEQGKNHSS